MQVLATLNWPDLLAGLFHYTAWVFAILVVFLWMRKVLTPAAVLSIWQTDGVLSARQILAWVISIYGMCMRSAGNLDNEGMRYCFEASMILFGIGAVPKVAERLKAPTTVKANTAEIDTKGGGVTVEKDVAPGRQEFNMNDL